MIIYLRFQYSCVCPSGFIGHRCEVNEDDCVKHKCENNATCIDLIGHYKCQCQLGFTGKVLLSYINTIVIYLYLANLILPFCNLGEYCEKKIPFCTKEFNPCKNGAKCIDHFSHYTCECPLGFQGQNCSVNIDDCVNHLCQVSQS